jgi:hypothetical protein
MGSFSKLLPLRLGFVQLLRPSILLRSHELMTLVLLGVACWQFVDGSALIGLVCLLVISLVVARGSFYDVEPKKKIEEKNNDNLTTKEESEENGEKKYAVVTGGTHGIGEELVSQLKVTFVLFFSVFSFFLIFFFVSQKGARFRSDCMWEKCEGILSRSGRGGEHRNSFFVFCAWLFR